ncbi:Planctomycete cytochrome C [Rubripirellula amarantea]|uniref:Planctomycete cytochrome C n=1 Tax=Rubripirellula amarantea TaxID=2527999 RepID=A0A5C5WL66_9BACT|nr:DUF1592 domain-containing protein [Rubripirellula amarantea]TWT50723.1 Planctomycete cytochrome C [Rubripirellula amarantea]
MRVVAGLMLLIAWGFGQPASADDLTRVRRGLQVFYAFDDIRSGLVEDTSGREDAIHLSIETPAKVKTHDGVIEIVGSPKIVASLVDSQRLADLFTASQAITIEMWMQVTDLNQSGPARIVTLSRDSSRRSVTLGQERDAIEVRLRTSMSDANGLPGTKAKIKGLAKGWKHIVFTRKPNREAALHVDGKRVAHTHHAGDLSGWDRQCRLAIADEIVGGRPWNGKLSMVALFDQALTDSEIKRNFACGHDGINEPVAVANPLADAERHFEQHIAPLLSHRCLECHDSSSREGGLDLSRKSFAFAGGDSGDAIVPSSPGESLVFTSVESDEMPHDRPSLSNSEKELLKQWIQDGAVWSVDYIDPSIYRGNVNSQHWVRRLTMNEYIETVRATLGIDIADEARTALPQDLRADGFRNTAYNLTVDLKHVAAYAELADKIIGRLDVDAFAKPYAMNRTHTDRNMRPLVQKMGKRILRGPLSDDEIALYRGVASTAALSGADYEGAVGYVLRAMLQSPRFLYRIENSDGSPNAYEIANRLSYTLWGGPPDDELVKLADEGELFSETVLRSQIDRMWNDPRCVDRSIEFVTQWLNLDRLDHMNPDRERFPDWVSDLAIDMRWETVETFRELVWQDRKPMVALLNVPYTYATRDLARHYGFEPQPVPWAKYDLSDVPSRGGILTHGSVLTMGGDNASMVTRGLFVLRDLLFSEVGDPPPGLDTTPVPTEPGLTHRVIASQRIENQSCGGCHRRFEPLAFGLEKFDGLGSYHEQDEHGNKLREDGEILFPGDAEPVKYETAAEMMDLLANSDRVAACLTRKVIQFCIGRPLDVVDARSVRQVHEAAGGKAATYQSIVTELLVNGSLR